MKHPILEYILKSFSKPFRKFLSILLLTSVAHFSWAEALNVYDLVPGLEQSDQYRFRVRENRL